MISRGSDSDGRNISYTVLYVFDSPGMLEGLEDYYLSTSRSLGNQLTPLSPFGSFNLGSMGRLYDGVV